LTVRVGRFRAFGAITVEAMKTQLRQVSTVERLEELIGVAHPMIFMKSIDALDEGSRQVLDAAPVAWFGYRDPSGRPRTTLVGGAPGFLRVHTPTRVSLELAPGQDGPVSGGVSFVFLVPGIGETLRLNGTVSGRSDRRVEIEVGEAFVHCARCILRSGLWKAAGTAGVQGHLVDPDAPGPLADPEVAAFLADALFIGVSSWDADDHSDTSPKGDHPGFLRVLDGATLAVPDRKGNLRTDTFHNLIACDDVSIGAVVPGRAEVLEISGTALLTDEPDLLAAMPIKGNVPTLAMVVRVDRAEVVPNAALRDSALWDLSARPDTSGVPNLMKLAGKHVAEHNKRTTGVRGAALRAVGRGMAAVPSGVTGRIMDGANRKAVADEGY
jgi:predicted pyridoxine 5'-phosphate oxidase superfamily flavin-nucleotide-binding protein